MAKAGSSNPANWDPPCGLPAFASASNPAHGFIAPNSSAPSFPSFGSRVLKKDFKSKTPPTLASPGAYTPSTLTKFHNGGKTSKSETPTSTVPSPEPSYNANLSVAGSAPPSAPEPKQAVPTTLPNSQPGKKMLSRNISPTQATKSTNS